MNAVYLDECVDRNVVPFLQRRGIRVITAQDQQTTGASDDDQIRYATAHGWLILTNNDRDFYRWHRRYQEEGRSHFGIVVVPQTALPSRFLLRCVMMLDWIAIEFEDTRDTLFRWTDLQQQLIHGYALPGYTGEEMALALGRRL